MVLGAEVEDIMEDIRRKWLGIEKEKPEGHLLSLMRSHDILIQDHTWLCCFDRKAVIPPASPEHSGQHLGSLALKAELLGPLQVILKPESLSFNKISSLLITTTSVCLESWNRGESSLQAVKCNDECGIKIWTDWNKEKFSWYSEKQHNISVLNMLRFILAKVRSSLEPTY